MTDLQHDLIADVDPTQTTDAPESPTTTEIPVLTEEPGLLDGFGSDDQPGRRLKRQLWIALAALIVLAVGGWFIVSGFNARQALADAQDVWDSAVVSLEEQIVAGQTHLAVSEGKVADEQVRTDLTDVLMSAQEIVALEPEGTDALLEATDDAAAAGTDITTAVVAVEASVERHAFDGALSAHSAAADRLANSVSSAQETLAATEGQVLDNTVREALATAIEAAAAITPVVPDETADLAPQTKTMTALTPDMTTAADNLDAARQGVVDAQSAWQVEQDRIAAEQAAQAAQAAEEARRAQEATTTWPKTSAPSNPSGSTQQRSKTTGGTKAPATGGSPSAPAPKAPAPATAPAPNQGGWVESGSDTWCGTGDTSGAEGTGGWC